MYHPVRTGPGPNGVAVTSIPWIQQAYRIMPSINGAKATGCHVSEEAAQRGVTDDFRPINDDTACPRVIPDGYFNMTPR